MPTIKITCPHCGFAKDVPAERLPQREVRETCPRCKQGFPFTKEELPKGEAAVPRQEAAATGPAARAPQSAANFSSAAADTPGISSGQPSPEPYRNPSLAELPVRQGGGSSKALLLCFVLIIALLVGVRLWADGKKRTVPFPNFIAASAQGVAVSWGQDVYFLNHAGKVMRKQTLPQDVILTQIKFVGDELWIADYAAKAIRRMRGNGLETVVNAAGRFRGAFKFAADLQAGQIFVTDASNHKVHTFTTDGRYLDSFGSEGKGPAELMFPNTVVFDQKGRLLIANTNAHRLDIFERDGEYVEPFAKVKPMGIYRFPTLLAQVGEKVAFLLTVDLREARVVMYGSDGRYLGELVPPKPIHESGDVAAWEGRVLVSDNRERKVYQFSADNFAYLGPFSAELDALGVEAARLESRYDTLANGALVALFVMCIPVLILYLRIRRRELLRIETTDFSRLIPAGALWKSELNRGKMAFGMFLMVLSLLFFLGGITVTPDHPFLALILYLGQAVLVILGWTRFAMESGFGSPARGETLVRLVRLFCTKAAGILGPGESVEACTAAWLRQPGNRPALLLFSNRRMLVWDPSVTRSGIRQLGYGEIAATALEPVRPAAILTARLLRVRYFSLNLRLKDGAGDATVQFSGTDQPLLERIRQYLDDKRGHGEPIGPLGCSVLCDTCFRPAGADGCTCSTQADRNNWKPLVLSLIYPGLGQFCNRELVRGTVNSALFSAGILMLTTPVIKMLDRSAEFTPGDVNLVAQYIAGLSFLYIVAALDADQVGRKGRKLFSEATGTALRYWLRARVAVMTPFCRKLLVELVPGVAHALAGTYQRAILFFIPVVYLFWAVGWSLLLIIAGHAGAADFQVFELGSALAAVLWIAMSIDGLRQIEPRRRPLSISVKGGLTILGIPCITLAAGVLAQLLWEKTVGADPVLRAAMQTFFRQLQLAGSARLGVYLSLAPSMFLGWGGAVMAMLAAVAWQTRGGKAAIARAAIAGFVGGAVSWMVCATALAGVLGSLPLLPVLFGSVIGLFVFLYFRNAGASPLLVPAIMSGAVAGFAGMIFLAQPLNSIRPFLGSGATRTVMVALPAYFMHVAYLVVSKALSAAGGSTSGGNDT